MANKNETVEQVCGAMIIEANGCDSSNEVIEGYELREFADRILAAHKRELAAVSAERDEWQKQALEENAALDVARAELTAKDAEIASVMGDLEKLLKNGDLLCVQKVKLEREIEKRNALIKELADALDVALENLSEECWTHCSLAEECAEKGNNSCIVVDSMKGLLEKAREMVK